jgi:methyl-accepting chemotaxis protein
MTSAVLKRDRHAVMSLKSLLAFLISASIAALLTLAGIEFWSQANSKKSIEQLIVAKDVAADVLPPPLYLIEIRLVLSQAFEGGMSVPQARSEFNRLQKEYQDRIVYWAGQLPESLKPLLGARQQESLAFIAAASKVMDLLEAGASKSDVATALSAAQMSYAAHRRGVDTTVKDANEYAATSFAQFESAERTSQILTGIAITVAVFSIFGIGLWVRQSIWSSVGGEPGEVAQLVHAVALGDLSQKIETGPKDQRSIMAAVNEMQANLGRIVSVVRAGSESVSSASSEIAQGNQDLSARTENQASSLEQTASSMEELSSTVKQNAENARQANQLAQSASSVAIKGGEVVSQVVETMKDINDSSKRIADIISVIDGIAFQTNILALNAAVEAARAGEQGRGFAVVASEVRSLAGRSAAAAKEIKELITTSVHKVEQGGTLVDEAGATMSEIVSSIRRVTDIMGEISTASNEQSIGVAQIGNAVTQMDQATQQNAALVEEMASAASSLNGQAQDLVQAMSVFKVGYEIASPSKPTRISYVAHALQPV